MIADPSSVASCLSGSLAAIVGLRTRWVRGLILRVVDDALARVEVQVVHLTLQALLKTNFVVVLSYDLLSLTWSPEAWVLLQPLWSALLLALHPLRLGHLPHHDQGLQCSTLGQNIC